MPMQGELQGDLQRWLDRAATDRAGADRSAAAAELHRLADHARFLYGDDHLPPADAAELAAGCRQFWTERQRIVDRFKTLDARARDDLFDVAICWADLQSRQPDALVILDEAKDLLGPSPVLDAERRLHGDASPRFPESSASSNATTQTAWDRYALGRSLLRSGELDRAATETEQAVNLEPSGLWPNFYQGVVAYRRGKYMDATASFGVCIGAAPDAAGWYFNRSLAFAALGRTAEALRDYDAARRLDGNLSAPSLDALRRTDPNGKSPSKR
jgi:tetratricopeptide (TPR) repeat protein